MKNRGYLPRELKSEETYDTIYTNYAMKQNTNSIARL